MASFSYDEGQVDWSLLLRDKLDVTLGIQLGCHLKFFVDYS